MFDPFYYYDLLILIATFSAWGWVLSAKLSLPGEIFGFARRIVLPKSKLSKPVYNCAACVAGAWGTTCTAGLCFFGLYDWAYLIPTVVISVAMAHFLDQ